MIRSVEALLLSAVAALALAVVAPGHVSASADADALGDASAGREVFATNCAACHGADAGGRGAAPSLGGVTDRRSLDGIETIVRGGRGGMPAFDARLDDGQIDDVIAHLARLPQDESVAPGRGPHMRGWWDDMMWDGTSGGFMLVWLVFGILLIALLVAGIVWLVRSVTSDGGRPQAGSQEPGSGPARAELDRRYARGELSREEYRQIRDDLEGG